MRVLILSFFIFLSFSAQAEYRAFRLMINPPAPVDSSASPTTPPPAVAGREVISTLDPDQYRGYYHVKPDEIITYTETWMCRENTGNFQEICPAPSRAPASAPATAPSTSSTPP